MLVDERVGMVFVISETDESKCDGAENGKVRAEVA
jgi:hypothetical protein